MFMARYALLISLLVSGGAVADEGGAVRTHDITIEDYFTLAIIDDCVVSPDGKYVAYVERRWEPPSENRNTDLWVVEVETKTTRRLTFDPTADTSPHWSPDSKTIYFLSGPKRAGESKPPYDGVTQVWRIGVDGGDLQAVTRVEKGVSGFDLAQDGSAVYYTVAAEDANEEWKDLRGKYKEFIEFGRGVRGVSELWKLDLTTWRGERLVAGTRRIREFAVSPDQKRIAMLTTPDARLISNEGWSRVDIYDEATKIVKALPDKLWRADAPSPYGWLENLAWRSDSTELAFTISFDGYPSEIFFAGFRGAEPTIHKLDRLDSTSVVGRLRWKPGTADLYFIGDRRAQQRLVMVMSADSDLAAPPTGAPIQADSVVESFSFSSRHDLVLSLSGPSRSNDLFFEPATKSIEDPYPLTDVNPQMATWKLPHVSRVQWKAPDGSEVEGVLELPPDYKQGDKPLPLVVDIHGGPTASSQYRFEFFSYGRTMFPAKGYALLSPNYRGSTGYGNKFLTDLIGRENDIEVQDILAGVDEMVKRGIADPERLAVIGWSNGGFLTNCLITTTTRFKAASSGAGVLDQAMEWGNEDTPGHVINYQQGQPWAKADAYRKASPLYKLDNVTTPTLIHVGANDERVPALHARTLFRALDQYLGVPCQLLVYPGEGHGLSKLSQRKAKMEWDAAWFDRYVLGQASRTPELPKAAN